MKKFKIELTEEELEAVIKHHIGEMLDTLDTNRSKRINDLTKRLKNDGPEITPIEQTKTVNEGWN